MLRRVICPKCNTELYLDDAQRVHYCDCCGNMLTVHNANIEKGKNNGKLGLIIACTILFILFVSVVSSGSSSDKNSDERKNETVEVAKSQPEKTMATNDEDKFQTTDNNTLEKTELKVEVPQKPERDGFDEFNNVVEWQGIRMEFPSYLMYELKDNELVGTIIQENNELPDLVIIIYSTDPIESTYKNNGLNYVKDNLVKELDGQSKKYTKKVFNYAAIKGYRIVTERESVEYESINYNINREYVPFICDNVNRVYWAIIVVREDSEYSYNNDTEKILNSITGIEDEEQQIVKEDKENNAKDEKKTETKTNDKELKKTETKTTNKTEKKTEEKRAASSGVNPEMKAFLDSYEAFMDKYVAFTKKYVDSAGSGDLGSYMAMYQDYMNLLAQLEDFERKADLYDSSKMSAEDLAYYLDSLNRIQKKMLEAYY